MPDYEEAGVDAESDTKRRRVGAPTLKLERLASHSVSAVSK
jgi:hypothetical protein